MAIMLGLLPVYIAWSMQEKHLSQHEVRALLISSSPAVCITGYTRHTPTDRQNIYNNHISYRKFRICFIPKVKENENHEFYIWNGTSNTNQRGDY